MGQNTTITVEIASGDPALAEEIEKYLHKKADKHTNILASGTESDIGVEMEGGKIASAYVQGSSRWDFEGVYDFAERVSRKFPELPVQVTVEWDNRDDDEAGGTIVNYLGGNETQEKREIGWKSSLSDEELVDSIIARNYPDSVEGWLGGEDTMDGRLDQQIIESDLGGNGIRAMMIAVAKEARA